MHAFMLRKRQGLSFIFVPEKKIHNRAKKKHPGKTAGMFFFSGYSFKAIPRFR